VIVSSSYASPSPSLIALLVFSLWIHGFSTCPSCSLPLLFWKLWYIADIQSKSLSLNEIDPSWLYDYLFAHPLGMDTMIFLLLYIPQLGSCTYHDLIFHTTPCIPAFRILPAYIILGPVRRYVYVYILHISCLIDITN